MRGRDVVHVEIEVVSDRGRPVAAALAVLRTFPDRAGQGLASAPAPRASAPAAVSTRPRISPFSQAMGIEVRSVEAEAVEMTMRRDVNEGLGSAVDPGALVALADTGAALACMPPLDERIRGSATLSLSAVFGDPLRRSALAVGRRVSEDAGVRSALVEVTADGSPAAGSAPGRSPRLAAMTACVAYRFRAAEPEG
jgi:acyl-coenzyme A thioesterase PaaI-like protein